MATTEDNQILRKRLQAKDNNIKRALKKFLQFSESLSIDGDADCDALAFGYLKELDSLELTANKVAVVSETLNREMVDYDAIHEQIDAAISQTKEDISTLKKQLEVEKVERKHREECEVLSRLAEKYPPRPTIMRDIEQLRSETETLRQKSDNMEATVELRRKQLRLIVHSLHELQRELLSEDVEDVEMKDSAQM